MPRSILYGAIILGVLALIPLALIARARATTSPEPRIHVVFDMDKQPKFRTQSANPMFADGRAMRPAIPDTVKFGTPPFDPAFQEGRTASGWITVMPVPMTMQLMERGQERYGIFCSPCHGLAGYGDGMVAKRADALQEGTWTPPASFHTDLVRSRPDGQIFNTITNGIRNMPAYGPQIPVADRWAIVAYVRALQLSQNATIADVSPEMRGSLR